MQQLEEVFRYRRSATFGQITPDGLEIGFEGCCMLYRIYGMLVGQNWPSSLVHKNGKQGVRFWGSACGVGKCLKSDLQRS